MRGLFIIALAQYLFLATDNSFAQKQDDIAIKFGQTITAADLSKHLKILASDEYEGRETGKKGQKMAAEYIANHFKSLNLAPVNGANAYFQPIPLLEESTGHAAIIINGQSYAFLKDFYCLVRANTHLDIQAKEVVFLGYGIEDERYNDYAGTDIKGKIVLIFTGEPRKNKVSYITQSRYVSEWTFQWRKKLEQAKAKGAAAILYVVPHMKKAIKKEMHSIQYSSMRLQDEQEDAQYANSLYISEEMAQQLLSSSQKDIKELKKQIIETGKPRSFSANCDISVKMEKQTKSIQAENVLGYLEGTDLKNELVIITAHYDHIGIDHKGEVYNGADDDGSGTVAVLELAEAFAQAAKEGHRPRRSILFMTVAGEEKGLLGSEYYTSHPVFPLANTVADLNIDMIGRIDKKHEKNPNYIYVIGSDKLSTELHQINENMNKTYTQLELDYTYNDPSDPNRFYYRSDHYNFAKNNIPIIFYFNGTHKDYHRPTDEVHKINFQKMEKIARLVFFTGWELANRDKRIEIDRNGGTH